MNKKLILENPINPIIIGLTGSGYGIHGWLKILSYTEKSENIFNYQPWFIKSINGWKYIKIQNWKHYGNNKFVIKINNINDRNSLINFYNCKIQVSSINLPTLNNNEFYWKDIIGCRVINLYGNDIGQVIDFIETGSNDVLIVKKHMKKNLSYEDECLIPFIDKQVIKKVDIILGIIEVDWLI